MELLKSCLSSSAASKEKSETDIFSKKVSRAIQRVSNSLSTPKAGVLIQVWMPETCSDGRVLLQTQGLPFSISGVGDLLALFRCVSCKYRFDSDPLYSESMGAIGRVYHYGKPEMCLDLQQYDKTTYLRIKEAQACRIHSTLIMPVFLREDCNRPIAVVEISHHDKGVKFNNIIQLFKESLTLVELHTADVHVDDWNLGLREWPVEVCSIPLSSLEDSEEVYYHQKHPKEKGISRDHSLAKAMQTGFGDVSDFLMMVGMDFIAGEGNFLSEETVDKKGLQEHDVTGSVGVYSIESNSGNNLARKHDQEVKTYPYMRRCLSDRSSTINTNEVTTTDGSGMPSNLEEETQHGGCQAQVAQLLAQTEAKTKAATTRPVDQQEDNDIVMLEEDNQEKPDSSASGQSHDSSENEKTLPQENHVVLNGDEHHHHGKKNENRLGGGAGRRLSYQDLEAHFGHGLKDAAHRLGICPTTLKRACRRNGINRWPARQISKLSKVWKQMGYKGKPPSWLLHNAIAGNLRSDNLAYVLNAGLHIGLQPTTLSSSTLSLQQQQQQQSHRASSSEDNDIIKNKTHHGGFTAALQGNESSFVFQDHNTLDQRNCNHTWHGGQILDHMLHPTVFQTQQQQQSLHSYVPTSTLTLSGTNTGNDSNSAGGNTSNHLGSCYGTIARDKAVLRVETANQSCPISMGFGLGKSTATNQRPGIGNISVLSDFAIMDHDDDDLLHQQFTGPLGFDATQHLFQ